MSDALPDPMMVGGPLLLVATGVDVWRTRKRGTYELRDTALSLFLSLGNLAIVSAFAKWIDAPTQIVSNHRIFDIGHQWWAFVLVFFADEFTYYWFHRLAHEQRWWWAAHAAHHNSQYYNFATGVRLGWTNQLSLLWWVAWLPLAFLGFPLDLLAFQLGISKTYQVLLHTEDIGRLPRIVEYWFNTPSHHRVHHARNANYLDANYGGILIIWDRLFGTYVEEDATVPCRYGLVKNLGTTNIVRVAFHEWIAMARDVVRARSWRERAHYVFGAPGWSPDGSSQTAEQMRAAWAREHGQPPRGR
jgi:sterol desaturase/sphingolipid hydroxylase (fatty acid hydroxylase superfamily)